MPGADSPFHTPSKRPRQRVCLVTGAAGFLGRYLCRTLHSAGFHVIGVGRGPSPGAPWGVRDFAELDLPCTDLREVVAESQPDVCIHAAGLGELPGSSSTARVPERQALSALASLLDAVDLGYRRSRIILISSAAVYGRPAELPATESLLRQPHTAYGRHKLDCELLVERFAHRTGVRVSIARVFNAYGPEQRRQVIWDLCRRAAAAKSGRVEVRGNGAALRDFIHVEDVARAVRMMAEDNAVNADILNVCTGCGTAIRDIVALIKSHWPVPLDFTWNAGAETSEPYDLTGDGSRLRSLGFEPEWNLQRGIGQYLSWFLASQPQATNS